MNRRGLVGVLLGAALLLAVAPAAASESSGIPPAPLSLLLSDADLQVIMEALYGGDAEEEVEVIEPKPVAAEPAIPETAPPPIRKKVRPVGPATLYLSAIVYIGPETWTIWLNGVRVTPDMRIGGIDIVSVGRDAVRLKMRVLTNRPPVSVRLRPNQTFVAATREVIEGAPRSPIAGYAASSP
ncbi:MAG: hypothetical protein IH906_01235 [Proteobacteria bacterium]|nr:hypothetical protein [Pseudomonadota bacterium]